MSLFRKGTLPGSFLIPFSARRAAGLNFRALQSDSYTNNCLLSLKRLYSFLISEVLLFLGFEFNLLDFWYCLPKL